MTSPKGVGKSSLGGRSVIKQRSRSVVWKPLAPDKVKLNIDGACRSSDGVASCGGVFRDSMGHGLQDSPTTSALPWWEHQQRTMASVVLAAPAQTAHVVSKLHLDDRWKEFPPSRPRVQKGTSYTGLSASPEAADSGFIPASDLSSQVLPAIKGSVKYGGAMLWSRYHDDQSGHIFHISFAKVPLIFIYLAARKFRCPHDSNFKEINRKIPSTITADTCNKGEAKMKTTHYRKIKIKTQSLKQ
ncbi:hypothetical protein V6N11_004715 [Hibiscus sabdariffa]|uniref:Uncharacterized protein n=1 Tax=Hibiscus sabdariffa TaxID=183260 RepID=A0ABR2SHD6_9ROSI